MDKHKDKTLDNISALFQRAKLSGLCQQAAFHSQQGRPEQALAILDQVIQAMPMMVDAHSNRGLVLRRLGRQEAALEAFEWVIDHFPDNAEAHNYRGIVLTDLGRMDEAMSSYHRAIELKPDFADVYHNITMLRKIKPGDKIVATMESLYESVDATSRLRIHLGFGLGKSYNDLRHYDKASYFYREANRIKRKTIHYNTKDYIEQVGYLRDLFTPDLFARFAGSGVADESPIFIVGMPRSGSTLLEQILTSHPGIEGAGEIPFIGQLAIQQGVSTGKKNLAWLKDASSGTLESIGKEYLKQLRIFGGENSRFITNKTLANFWYIGFIHLILPKARIIHIKRDARDNCLSIFTSYFTDDIPYAYDLTELGRHFCLYTSLMDHWKNVIPGHICEISYEDLAEDTEGEVRRLLDYCNLPFDGKCLKSHENKRAVQTASFVQVRKPLYRSSVGRWKSYEKMLLPLILALKEG